MFVGARRWLVGKAGQMPGQVLDRTAMDQIDRQCLSVIVDVEGAVSPPRARERALGIGFRLAMGRAPTARCVGQRFPVSAILSLGPRASDLCRTFRC